MTRRGRLLGAAVALAMTLGACTSTTAARAPSAPTEPTAPPTALPPLSQPVVGVGVCTTAGLTLHRGPDLSEATQQNSRLLALTNTSSAACHLKGYPRIVLETVSGKPIRFRYRDGGDQMITSRPPVRVTLASGGSAYFLINQRTCDSGDKARAAFVTVTLPRGAGELTAPLGVYPIIAFCGPDSPFSVVHVSPIEPTANDAFSFS